MLQSERDKAIFLSIARYGLATPAALQASVLRGLNDKAVERVITRLLGGGLLQSQPLVGRKCYYTLTPYAAQQLGLPGDSLTLPMGAQALLQNYAMLAFCLLGSVNHQRLLRSEFQTKLPALASAGFTGNGYRTRYYLDATDKAAGKVRLALMLPDLGSHPRRLLRKARREIEKRRAASPQFADLIQAKLFSATILTAFPDKARQLAAALAKEPFHSRTVQLDSLAELVLFLRRPRRESQDRAVD